MTNPMEARRRTALLGLLCIVLVLGGRAEAAEGGGAVVSGVVRDAQGVVQMGALVQVLTGNAVTVATAFTDDRGRYSIRNLVPGTYAVRASGMLFVPATRGNLLLQNGARTVVNLTMAALFDTASWLPASRRRANEPDDDWKWTLRSSADRPILRLLEDGDLVVVVPEGRATGKQVHGQGFVDAGSGEFGEGGEQSGVTLHGVLMGGGDGTIRAVIGTPDGVGTVSSTEMAAAYESRARVGGGSSRTVVKYTAEPRVLTGDGGAGVEVFEMKSAQREALGENVALEAGGSVEAVRAGGETALEAHPFVRLTALPASGWRLQYRMATARDTQEFADVVGGHEGVPVAALAAGKLRLERGRHQELSASRRSGRAVMEVAVYHDALQNAAVTGGIRGAGFAAASVDGLMMDPFSGTFQTLGMGYVADGARFTLSGDVSKQLWLAAEYTTGNSLSVVGGAASAATVQAALLGLKTRGAEAAAIAVRGKFSHTGTSVRAAYRWQPASTITAVDPYGALSDQAFLSCVLRQHLKLGNKLPPGLDATVDVTNLMAQGYRPFLSADGRTLYFAQAPRTVQAGLSFTF